MIGFEFYDNPQSPEQNGRQSTRLATGDQSGAECHIQVCVLFVNMASYDPSFLAYERVIQQALSRLIVSKAVSC